MYSAPLSPSTHIQVRNVPEATHRTLKARAALAGMSLSDYLRQELDRLAAVPTLEEFQARLRARPPVELPGGAERWVQEARQEREGELGLFVNEGQAPYRTGR